MSQIVISNNVFAKITELWFNILMKKLKMEKTKEVG